MTWINKSNGKRYRFGALQTDNGVIFNPTEAVLKAHGFEPYVAPTVEAEPIPAEEQRRQAYVAECDPLLVACIGYLFEGNDAEAEKCKQAYLSKKSEIRERIPDSE